MPAVKHHGSMHNLLFDLLGRVCTNYPLEAEKNDEHGLDFVLNLPRLFWSWQVWTFPFKHLHAACLIIARPPSHFFLDVHKI
jgi:hypothetical protein